MKKLKKFRKSFNFGLGELINIFIKYAININSIGWMNEIECHDGEFILRLPFFRDI